MAKIFVRERIHSARKKLQAVDQKFKTSQPICMIRGHLDKVHLLIGEFA